MNNDKFVWQKHELAIAKNQCELCIYNNKNEYKKCIKYPKGKDADILNNKKACPELKMEGEIDL